MRLAKEIGVHTLIPLGQIKRIAICLGASLLLHIVAIVFLGPQPSSIYRPLPLLVKLQTTEQTPDTILETPVPVADRIPLATAPLISEPPVRPEQPPTPMVRPDPFLAYLPGQETDVRAELLNDVDLVYPERALMFRVAGKVRLTLFINENGDVDEVTIIEAKPPDVFDRSAKEAALALKYKPAEKLGRPVKSRRTIEVTFDPYNRAQERNVGQR